MRKESIQQRLRIDLVKLNAYSTGLLQGTAYNRLHAQLTRALFSYELSVPEWKLLGQLHEHGKMRLAELAEYLDYDPPMVTKLVKRLEKKFLLGRLPDKLDERAKIVTITYKGGQLIESIEPVVKKSMSVALQGISRDELLIYLKVLVAIVNNTE